MGRRWRLRAVRRTRQGTRRVVSMAAEQEDGLAEPRGAKGRELVDAAGAIDEANELRGSCVMLLDGREADIGGARRIVHVRDATELDEHRRPAAEQ